MPRSELDPYEYSVEEMLEAERLMDAEIQKAIDQCYATGCHLPPTRDVVDEVSRSILIRNIAADGGVEELKHIYRLYEPCTVKMMKKRKPNGTRSARIFFDDYNEAMEASSVVGRIFGLKTVVLPPIHRNQLFGGSGRSSQSS